MLWIEWLDYIGTLVFAISGALAAMRKRFDPFGVLILGMVTAIGGGTLRDIMIGRTPVGWMQNTNYFILIGIGVVIAMVFRNQLAYYRRTMFLFDAIGLALFTVIGIEIGQESGLTVPVCLLLGTVSACFGGVIRDILCNSIPIIFHKEIYASICIVGGILFLILQQVGVPKQANYIVSVFIMVVIRILAVKRRWKFSRTYPRLKGQ